MIFNDGQVLFLRSETVAVHRRMNIISDDYDGQMIPEDECGPNFLTVVLQLRKTQKKKNLNTEIDPTGDQTRAAALAATTLPQATAVV